MCDEGRSGAGLASSEVNAHTRSVARTGINVVKHLIIEPAGRDVARVEHVGAFDEDLRVFKHIIAGAHIYLIIGAPENWIAALSRGDHCFEEPATPVEGELRLRARYLVGADGSNSFVRDSLGVERHDFGFNERWLCVDTEPQRPLPAKFNENAVQVCDPKRGYMFMPIGRKRQRFEFALLPGESTEAMQTHEAAYKLLQQYHGLERADVKLIRNLVYTFECRLAKAWRVGRVFL